MRPLVVLALVLGVCAVPGVQAALPWPFHVATPPLDRTVVEQSVARLHAIDAGSGDPCDQCRDRLRVGKSLALARPDLALVVFEHWCVEQGGSRADCHDQYGGGPMPDAPGCADDFSTRGPDWVRMLQLMDVEGLDGSYYCAFHGDGCVQEPDLPDVDVSAWWRGKHHKRGTFKQLMDRDKGVGNTPELQHSRFNVLHLSDLGLQPDYQLAAESNCSQPVCCMASSHNHRPPPLDNACLDNLPQGVVRGKLAPEWLFYHSYYRQRFERGQAMDIAKVLDASPVWLPAHEFGAYHCDTPMLLLNSSLRAVGRYHRKYLHFAHGIVTGGLVDGAGPRTDCRSDMLPSQLHQHSLAAAIDTLHFHLPDVPLGMAPGPFDLHPRGYMAPVSSGRHRIHDDSVGLLQDRMRDYGWRVLDDAAAVRSQHMAYTQLPRKGWRIVYLNLNAWTPDNLYLFVDTGNVELYTQLRYLVRVLLECEEAGDAAWIVASVPPTDEHAMPVAAEMLRQITARFAPTVLRALLFGHGGHAGFRVLYDSNGEPQHVAQLAPLVLPRSGANPGWCYYSVDAATFAIADVVLFYTPLNATFANGGREPEWVFGGLVRALHAEYHWVDHRLLGPLFYDEMVHDLERDVAGARQAYADQQWRRSPATPDCACGECHEFACTVASYSLRERHACLARAASPAV